MEILYPIALWPQEEKNARGFNLYITRERRGALRSWTIMAMYDRDAIQKCM